MEQCFYFEKNNWMKTDSFAAVVKLDSYTGRTNLKTWRLLLSRREKIHRAGNHFYLILVALVFPNSEMLEHPPKLSQHQLYISIFIIDKKYFLLPQEYGFKRARPTLYYNCIFKVYINNPHHQKGTFPGTRG